MLTRLLMVAAGYRCSRVSCRWSSQRAGHGIGGTAGYLRCPSHVLMRTMDMLYAFPRIMLAIAISASLGPGRRTRCSRSSVVFIPRSPVWPRPRRRRRHLLEYNRPRPRLSGASKRRASCVQVLPNIFNPSFGNASGLIWT